MAVRNVHRRVLRIPVEDGEALLRSLASHEDQLWPGDKWWPQRFEGGLVAGAKGGHGPVRYKVESVAARSVVYRFPARGTVHGRGRLMWPLAVRWLHDALVEDVLDRAQAVSGALPTESSRHNPYVRFLRRRVLHLGQP